MLRAYINGLSGIVGKQVRYRMPFTLTEAVLQIAITVQEVEAVEACKQHNRFGFNQNQTGRAFVLRYTCNQSGHSLYPEIVVIE